MKGLSTLIAIQALLSTLSGILMSQMSWVGKVGIRFMYTQYGIFKIWWKTALLLFGLQLLLLLLLWLFKRLLPGVLSGILMVLFFIAGALGAYVCYIDFTTTNHRMLKESFHNGAYLIWGAWMLSCVYFLVVRRRRKQIAPKGKAEVLESGTTDEDTLSLKSE